MNRAQITIETLIVIGVIMLIFVSVSLPLTFSSSKDLNDVQLFSDAKFVLDSISMKTNSITTDYGSGSLVIHIPGFTSAGTAGGEPLIQRTTKIYLDATGDKIFADVSAVRRNSNGTVIQNETKVISKELLGSGWVLGNSSGNAVIVENRGTFYAFNISWKNITFSRE
ncbi:MAG TPA: hypothetical protein ENH28_06585 [Euryarchaeota archaeon]|nr:hypothetical protein BMS3Bbin15_00435 [archaeon BMS3Bbin15]HDL15797.1 hypothetical protein [Euryarchaeota archaeon]